MKTIVLLGCLLIGGVAVCAAVPSVKVTITDANDKIVYNGLTNTSGLFRTPNLPTGDYVVQFRSRNGGQLDNQYLLVVSAGTKKVIADAVRGEQFAGGGVAMRVNVRRGLPIEGQMATEQSVSVAGNPNMKIVNGHRFFYVLSATGSNLGPHWEEEGVGMSRNVVHMDRNFVQHIVDHFAEGSLLDRYQNGLGGNSEAAEYSGH